MRRSSGLPITWANRPTLKGMDMSKVVLRPGSSALRAALAQQDVCEWTYDEDGFFQSDCKEASYMPDLDVGHPQEFMKFCYGCGKPIKFLESDDE